MEHFSEAAWADFGRGFGGSEKTEGIQAHLAADCAPCRAASRFWERMQSMARAEQAYSAPEDLVRLAKLEFSARQEFQAGKWSLANLLFDSLAQPVLAGVRSGAAVARQVMYEADGLIIDLRFDVVVPSARVSAVGQILDSQLPPEPLTGAPVVLWTENGQPVATTAANEYGEFQLEFEARNDLRLTASVGSRRVGVPVANFK